MINRIRKRVAVLMAVLLLAHWSLVMAVDQPGISLFGFDGGRELSQSADDPLLLFVTIDHSAAAIVRSDNARNKTILEEYSQTEDYRNLTEPELQAFEKTYAIRKIPQITLGSSAISLESLIDIQVRNQQGDTVELGVRPLAVNDHRAMAIELDEQRNLFYRFAVDSESLKKLPAGTYYLVAALDTREQPGMWQGWVYSKTVELNLTAHADDPAWADSNRRALLLGTFLLDDKKYIDAEAHARSWIEQHPDSVDAWSTLGEALYGQGQVPAALQAFNTAVGKFREKHGNSPVELPQELLDRIDEIEMDAGENATN